jgi:hypothetical protein
VNFLVTIGLIEAADDAELATGSVRADSVVCPDLMGGRPVDLIASVVGAKSACCSYEQAYTTTSSREINFYSATFVLRGWLRPTINSCTWFSSVMVRSRQDSVMNQLQNSLIEPSYRRRASSPMGLSVNRGPKWIWISWTKWFHDGRPPLSSRW